MKICHVNRACFAYQIVRCYDQVKEQTFSERIYTWLVNEKAYTLQNIRWVDMNLVITNFSLPKKWYMKLSIFFEHKVSL